MKAPWITVLMCTAVLAVGMVTVPAVAGTSGQPEQDAVIELLKTDAQEADRLNIDYKGILPHSQVAINLLNGEIRFEVKDWPVETRSVEEAPLPMIKGTLVCGSSAGAQATLVDTPAVPLGEHGQASFAGQVNLPATCITAPDDLTFFVRTAAVASQ